MTFKFVDLFAGLGGFHAGLAAAGGECVGACEIDDRLRDLYANAYGVRPFGDIRGIRHSDLPYCDLLAAGFPCQDFSNAGKKLGFEGARGLLFYELLRVIEGRKPPFLMLENVPGLLKMTREWAIICKELNALGYRIEHRVICPTDFGVPHYRPRVIILGALDGELGFPLPGPSRGDLREYMDVNPQDGVRIGKERIRVIDKWGARMNELARKPGGYWYGGDEFAGEKKSLRKCQWTAPFKPYGNDVWDSVIAFRQGGVRITPADVCPTQTAMYNHFIWGAEQRFMTVRELARLQGLEGIADAMTGTLTQSQARQALGNAVSADVVFNVMETLKVLNRI